MSQEKLLVSIVTFKELSLSIITWNGIMVCKLLKLDRNKKYQLILCTSLVLDKNTWNYITVQIICVNNNVKLATVVEGDQKASFWIATTPRCRGGRYFFLKHCSILPLIRTLYCWVLSKEVSSTIFKVFGMTRPGIEPRSPGPLSEHSTHEANEPVYENCLQIISIKISS